MPTPSASRESSTVSIVIPVFNTPSSLLDRSMTSILTQSWESIDVIMVDDGSGLACAAECDSYAEKDARVRVLHQENQGVSDARNRGIDASRGEFVMFVDPDDELLPGAVRESVEIAVEHDADVVYATEIDVEDGVRASRSMGLESQGPLVIEDREWLDELRDYFIAHESRDRRRAPRGLSTGPVARLIRWRALEGVRFDERLAVLEDAVFNSCLLASVERVVLLDRPWYVYYKNQGSATQSMNFDGTAERQSEVVGRFVGDNGLSEGSYCSHMATYFMMTMNSLARRGELSYGAVRRGYATPCFKAAFERLDPGAFDFSSASPRIQYELMHGMHSLAHYLFYRALGLAKSARRAFLERSVKSGRG